MIHSLPNEPNVREDELLWDHSGEIPLNKFLGDPSEAFLRTVSLSSLQQMAAENREKGANESTDGHEYIVTNAVDCLQLEQLHMLELVEELTLCKYQIVQCLHNLLETCISVQDDYTSFFIEHQKDSTMGETLS